MPRPRGLARTATPGELFELFARYGCRDFRDIGHKAIFVANAFRALEVIGWQHAEPVLRSLTYALLHHEGENPAKRDARTRPTRPPERGTAREDQDADADGRMDAKIASEVLAASRTASADDLCDNVVSLLNGGAGRARAIWDGLFLGGGELLMRQPGIVALHSLTSLNALHYAYRTTGDESTRKFTLLQAAAFVPLFREAMKSRGKVGEVGIE